MGRPELWTTGVALPKLAARLAAGAEAAGWDGMVFPDSQNLAGDVYVGLAMAVGATSRLMLGTGVTNPFTRHPAVTAAAIASVQAESGGRAILGIGRGDSSLAHLGLAPAPLAVFRRYLERVQTYLRGEAVTFDPTASAEGHGSVDELALAAAPRTSQLHWLRPGQPKVPVDVAATGPKVIALAASRAERVTFAVGADPERVAWAVASAHEARTAAGLDPAALSLGAYVNVVAHPDVTVGRALAAGGLASFARFSVMHGTPTGPVTEAQRAVLEEISHTYDMAGHFRSGSPQSAALTEEFSDRFGIIGPPAECVSRLRRLLDLGLDRLVIVGPAAGADREESAKAGRLFLEEVLPALR